VAGKPLLAGALGLAKRGLHIFPCHGVADGRCTCGKADCGSPGKHPNTPRGLLDATTDAGQIRKWWAQWPSANPAIACGPSGLVIVDVDPRHAGDESLRALEQQHGALPDTVRVLTGEYPEGRGTHYYFKCPPGVEVASGANVLGPGVDIRAAGGYCVTAHAEHISGARYAWDVGSPSEVALLPEWISVLASRRPATVSPASTSPGKIGAGARNASLTSIAGSMRRAGLGPDAILAALRTANESCEPPLPEKELTAIARSVGRYEPATSAAVDDAVVLASVKVERVEWLCAGRIALGRLTLLDGDPGLGKSTVALDIGGRLTTGRPMPGESAARDPAGVVLIAPEDGLGDTIRPRFEAAGGDSTRVVAFRRLVTLPDDIEAIESACARVGAKLIVVDPLMAALGRATDSHRDQDCRRALGPLALLAERIGAAVLVIRHLNKSESTDPMRRGGGSVGILGAARAALLLARDPDGGEDDRVLACYKSNLGRPPAALKLRMVGADGAVRVEWRGSSRLEAGDLLAPKDARGGSLAEAAEWLTEQLSDGPRLAKDLAGDAARDGVAWRTLKRARADMPITVRKQIGTGQWEWQLSKSASDPPVAPLGTVGTLDTLDMDANTHAPRARARDHAVVVGPFKVNGSPAAVTAACDLAHDGSGWCPACGRYETSAATCGEA